jgi:5-hydroxyisourate hydrolase
VADPTLIVYGNGRLTTHVLDTAQGIPAAHMRIDICWWPTAATPDAAATWTVTTNADGRTTAPLRANGDLARGIYELLFFVSDYFAAHSVAQNDPPFLSQVTVRFAIADPEQNYHVPLLVSPWSYTTYRGS